MIENVQIINLLKKKVIVFFGAPGAGKGTYAKLLKKDL